MERRAWFWLRMILRDFEAGWETVWHWKRNGNRNKTTTDAGEGIEEMLAERTYERRAKWRSWRVQLRKDMAYMCK